jgi:hypothetical protein
LEKPNFYFAIFQICKISYFLQKSAIHLDCSEELTKLQDIDLVNKRKILDRSGQFDQEGEGLNICDAHNKALTSNFKKSSICLSENHDENNRRLSPKDMNNVHVISPELSLFTLNNTGFLLPKDGYICNLCRKQMPAMPKKKKEQDISESPQAGSSGTNPRSNKQTVELPKSSPTKVRIVKKRMTPGSKGVKEVSPPPKKSRIDSESDSQGDAHFGNVRSNKQTKVSVTESPSVRTTRSNKPTNVTPLSGSGSESLVSAHGSDTEFKIPSQDAQDDRVKGLNKLLEFNNMKPRFRSRMTEPFESYPQSRQYDQMELIVASFQAVINTVSSNKNDHGKIWGKVLESHKMDGKLLGYADKLLLDMIQVYNNCVSDKERTQVSENLCMIAYDPRL